MMMPQRERGKKDKGGWMDGRIKQHIPGSKTHHNKNQLRTTQQHHHKQASHSTPFFFFFFFFFRSIFAFSERRSNQELLLLHFFFGRGQKGSIIKSFVILGSAWDKGTTHDTTHRRVRTIRIHYILFLIRIRFLIRMSKSMSDRQ